MDSFTTGTLWDVANGVLSVRGATNLSVIYASNSSEFCEERLSASVCAHFLRIIPGVKY